MSSTGRVKYLYRSARASLACAWFFGFLLHDDVDAIKYWIAKSESAGVESTEGEIIETLFRCMSKVSDPVWNAMLGSLDSSSRGTLEFHLGE